MKEKVHPRVIVCTTSYRPYIGGAEIAIEEVARRLFHEFDFYILTARMSRGLLRRERVPEGIIIRLGFGLPFDKWFLPIFALWHIGSLVNNVERTLLWGMDISQGSLAAAVIGWRFPRVPFVLTIQYGESEQYLWRGRIGFIGRAFRFMLRRADTVTAISSYLSGVTRSYGYCGALKVIYNGVDTARFKNATRKDFTGEGNTIVTVSRLVEKNAVDVLIRAVREVRESIPDLRCQIIGDGAERARLESLAVSCGVSDVVAFLGSIDHAQIPALLHTADLFVRVSRSEGMGISFVEAMAAGVPVIATAVGGIPDVIDDAKTGFFVAADDPHDLAKKIVELLHDAAIRKEIAGRAEKKVEAEFDWKSIAVQYGAIFSAAFGCARTVVVATSLYPPDIGGPATYSHALAEHMPERGIGVRVVSFGMVRHLPRAVRHVAYFIRLLVASRGCDVIYAQDPVSVGFPAACAAWISRKKLVMKIVGDYAWEQASQRFGVTDPLDEFLGKKYGWRVEFFRWVERWSARRADRIIVPSEYLGGVVVQWGVHRENITVVYNGFEAQEENISKHEARQKLGLTGTVLVSVGRLVPWKGFERLISLAGKLKKDIPDILLVIIGDGPERRRLEEQIRDSGAESFVRLAGSLPHSAVLDAFAAGDALVLNTRYEGFSHTLLEAMAVGIPVATTRAGGNSELIRDRESGVFFGYDNEEEMREAVLGILGDQVFSRGLVRCAQEKAWSFSNTRMLDETTKVLRKL